MFVTHCNAITFYNVVFQRDGGRDFIGATCNVCLSGSYLTFFSHSKIFKPEILNYFLHSSKYIWINDDDDLKVNRVMNKGFCHLMTGLMHHNGPRGLLAQASS